MLDKIKQAQRMWKNGSTHGEIKEVTGLNDAVEYAATNCNTTAETVFALLPKTKEGMKSKEIEGLFK
jgi:hypothetical protein